MTKRKMGPYQFISILLFMIPFAHPKMVGPLSDSNTSRSDDKTVDIGAPAPPPPDYVHPMLREPPTPEIKVPKGHLTSQQINERFASVTNEEDKSKTIDQIIMENTEDLGATDVRELDVRVAETGAAPRRKRAADDTDEDYDYEYDGNQEAPEAPGLSLNEIEDLPPLDKVATDVIKKRNPGDTIDQLLLEGMADSVNKELPKDSPASSLLLGRASTRGGKKGDVLLDHDMLLTKDQAAELFDNGNKRRKRAGIKSGFWTRAVVPYQLMSNTFSEADKTQIYAAMRDWQRKTCIRFEPYTQSLATQLKHKNRIVLQNGGGCSSYVGMLQRGPQPVTLARGCRIASIVAHELGHAIGLHHEQCRTDRDDFVTISTQNVHAGMRYNFDKYTTRSIDSRNIPYDYHSIMHYGKTAFSSNGRITIQPKDRTKTDVIGTAKEVSGSDAAIVKLQYKCQGNPVKPTTTKKPITTCRDTGEYCAYWKKADQCTKNPGYMTRYCTKTCGKCGGGKEVCTNENNYCQAWADAGYCTVKDYKAYMSKRCAKSCGTCGSAYSDFEDLWGTNMPTDAAAHSAFNAVLFFSSMLLTKVIV